MKRGVLRGIPHAKPRPVSGTLLQNQSPLQRLQQGTGNHRAPWEASDQNHQPEALTASSPSSCRHSDVPMAMNPHGVLRCPRSCFVPGRCHPPALGDPIHCFQPGKPLCSGGLCPAGARGGPQEGPPRDVPHSSPQPASSGMSPCRARHR